MKKGGKGVRESNKRRERERERERESERGVSVERGERKRTRAYIVRRGRKGLTNKKN